MSHIINPFRFGGTFSPADLTHIIHWWKALEITGLSNTDPVSTWPDLIGSADFTGSSTTRPLYYTNSGDPYVEFDGTDDYLQATVTALSADAVIVAVLEYLSASPDYGIFLNDSATLQFGRNWNQNSLLFRLVSGGDLTVAMPSSPTGDMAFLYERIGSSGRASINNTESTGTVGTGTTGTTLQMGQFQSVPGTYNGNIRVKEIFICDDSFETGEEANVATYLSDLYGVTL